MNRKYAFLLAFALVGGLVVACGGGMAEEPVAEGGGDASGGAMYSAEAGPGMVPMFEVDPTWPNNLPNHWLMGPTIGVDVDAVAGQIGSYAGGNSPSDISRGVFAAEVGAPRMLKLFDTMGIPTSWFIPGHSIETFPKEMKDVAAAGHEIGLHGYTHENPIAMTPEQEADVLDKTLDLVTKLYGKRPTGYVAPWWEMRAATPHLFIERG